MADTFEIRGTVAKVDDSLGLVFGFGAVCTEDGQPYYDTQDEHASEAELLKALLNFVEHWQIAGEKHATDDAGLPEIHGSVPFVFPLLSDVAKALDIQTPTTGALIAMKPTPEVFAKFKSGEYRSFSMGGTARRRIVEA
ncbi:MAG: hypothetical protein F4Y02_12930 [Chloroflexi bacterium]|nr:hypothetical protein [Chloroflexota bacterium]